MNRQRRGGRGGSVIRGGRGRGGFRGRGLHRRAVHRRGGRGRGGFKPRASGGGGAGVTLSNEVDVRRLQVGGKSLVVSLCENEFGRFVKVSESTDAAHNKIIIPEGGVARFTALVKQLQGTTSGSNGTDESNRASLRMSTAGKFVWLDAGRNRFGPYLRISTESRVRFTVTIPAPEGTEFLLAALEGLVAEHGIRERFSELELPPPQQVRVSTRRWEDSKRFFFDARANERGVYLRVSEVASEAAGGVRRAIHLPYEAWDAAIGVMESFRDEVSEQLGGEGGDDAMIATVTVGRVGGNGNGTASTNSGSGSGAGAGAGDGK